MTNYAASIASVIGNDGAPVGTGIVLDRRRVLTCAHVVAEAVGADRGSNSPPTNLIQIKIPFRAGGNETYKAVVRGGCWIPASDDPQYGVAEDIAVLELVGEVEFPSSVEAAQLASVDLSNEIDRPVSMTGFPGGGSSEKVAGLVQGVDDRGRLQIDPQKPSREVSGGFSGAGVLDLKTGYVVGMLVTKRTRAEATLAFALPLSTIVKVINLPLRDVGEAVHHLPVLPRNFVLRADYLKKLRDQILSGKNAGVVGSRPTALKGMGGIGKTVLVKALLRDAQIAAAFGAERYWVSLGADRSPVDAQIALLKSVTGERFSIEHVDEGRSELRHALADKPRLIALDDVWTADQIAAFEDVGPAVTLVVTTRRAVVAQRIGAELVPLDVLEREQSRELLAAWANLGKAEQLPSLADEVIAECGALPLAIAIFGAAIAASDLSWRDGLEALRDRDLGDLKRPIEGYQDNEGVFGAIALSMSTLSLEDQTAFTRCAIFPEDQTVPISAFRALWHDLAESKNGPRFARRLCARLEDASLLTRDEGASEERWKIHDLVKDYLHARLDDEASTHRSVVEGYLTGKAYPWTEFKDDGYALDWLPHHINASHLPDDQLLKSMLLDCDWLQAKQTARSTRAVVSDLALLIGNDTATLVGDALRLSAHVLDNDPKQLPVQLLGRLNHLPVSADLQRLLSTAKSMLPAGALIPRSSGYLIAPGVLRETFAGPARTRVGHVELFSDGCRVLSWSDYRSDFRIWDTESGESEAFGGEGPLITRAEIMPGEKHVISSHFDGSLRLWDLQNKAPRVLDMHGSYSEIVHVFSDGRRVLSTATDGILVLWECFSFRVKTFDGHTSSISGAVVLPGEREVITWSQDNTVRLWNLETGEVRVFEGHEDWVDGARLLSSDVALSWSHDSTLRVWNLRNGQAKILYGHSGWSEGVQLTRDKKRALFCYADGSLRLWNLETGDMREFKGHKREVNGVQMFTDERRALSWSSDHTLRLWDLETGQFQILEGHRRAVNGALILDGERYVLSWSKDSNLRLWDLESGSSKVLEAHKGAVNGALFYGKDGKVLSWANDGSLRIWDLSSPSTISSETSSSPVYGIQIAKRGRRAVSCLGNGNLQLTQIDTGEVSTLRGHRAAVHGAEIFDEGQQALSWSKDGNLMVWDLSSLEGRSLNGHTAGIAGARILKGERRALSWSKDRTLRLWDLEGDKSDVLVGHRGPVTGALEFSNSHRIASWSKDSTIRVWDLRTQGSVILEGHDGPVNGALFVDDERSFISWSKDGTIRLWDFGTGSSRVYKGHHSSIIAVRIPPSGKQFLSWSGDNTLRLWQKESGLSRILYDAGSGGINAELSADGRRILCWSKDGILRLWNVGQIEPLLLEGHEGPVRGVRFINGARRLLSWAADNTIKLWDLDRLCLEGTAILDSPPSDVATSIDDKIAMVGDGNGRTLTFDLPEPAKESGNVQ